VGKDKSDDYTQLFEMYNAFQKTSTYKHKVAIEQKYKERLRTCGTREDFRLALQEYLDAKQKGLIS
jgi:hypothetical protein